MKDRLVLLLLIIILWMFLFLLNIYFPTFLSTIIVLAFMTIYCAILALAQLYIRIFKTTKNELKQQKDYFPFVNIFVPAHNEELVLKGTIENLVKIDYPHYDILIIDDRSQDRTLEIAKELSNKYHGKVKFHSRNEKDFPGKSAVLNDALEITSGEVICVFDSDARVDKDFLLRVIPYLYDKNTAAVQVRKIISNKDFNLLTKCQHYEYCLDANIQRGRDSFGGAVELRGNGELIKRPALEVVNGWNNYTLTDDLDISTKLHLANYNIRFCPDVYVYEEAVTSVQTIIKQRKRWAEGSIRRYLDYSDDIMKFKNLANRVTLDMISYFSEFVLPVWLISDIIIQLVMRIAYNNGSFLMTLYILTLIAAFFIVMLFSSILKYDKSGILNVLKYSFLTAVYLILLWTIVVFIVVLKIIFLPKDMKWDKTQRVGVVSDLK